MPLCRNRSSADVSAHACSTYPADGSPLWGVCFEAEVDSSEKTDLELKLGKRGRVDGPTAVPEKTFSGPDFTDQVQQFPVAVFWFENPAKQRVFLRLDIRVPIFQFSTRYLHT